MAKWGGGPLNAVAYSLDFFVGPGVDRADCHPELVEGSRPRAKLARMRSLRATSGISPKPPVRSSIPASSWRRCGKPASGRIA